MTAWTPDAFAAFNNQGITGVQEVVLRPGAPPIKVLVGSLDALIGYRAVQRNPILAAALEVDPPAPAEADAAPDAPAPTKTLADRVADTLHLYDRAFALAILEPRYYPLGAHQPSDPPPMDGVCVCHSFTFDERARLLAAIQGDTTAAESFRPGPASAAEPASDRGDVPPAAERPGDAPGAPDGAAPVRRGDSLPRAARRTTRPGHGAQPAA